MAQYKTPPGMVSFLTDHRYNHPSLSGKQAVDFIADYLTELLKFVRHEVLAPEYGLQFLKQKKISYIITVPAIWTDKAKGLTLQAADRAGIQRRSLSLITEPEAAALYCTTLSRDVHLSIGDRFVVCDAGGGTVVTSLHDYADQIGPSILQSDFIGAFSARRMHCWYRWGCAALFI